MQYKCLSENVFMGIDLYTTANIDELHPDEQSVLIHSCVEQILEFYKMLGVSEVKDAFKMFASNKLVLKLIFYKGKFFVNHLSDILDAYLVHRKKYISAYENQSNLLEWRKPKPEEVVKERNLQAAKDIKESYKLLLTHFKENGDLEYLEKKIGPNWGKVLVKEGVVSFTMEEKGEIVNECKVYVAKQIENVLLAGKADAVTKKGLKDMRAAFKNKEHNSDFKGRWHARYDKLIVIKSILKAH